MLTHSEIVSCLLERGLIRPASLMDGDLAVEDASRRNHNFKVFRSDGPGYLLKQGLGAERATTVAHEAAVYQALHGAGRALARFLPRVHAYDDARRLLVLELVPGARALSEHSLRRRRFPTTFAAEWGTALGALHRLDPAILVRAGAPVTTWPPPWILSIHRPGLGLLRDCSSANLGLTRLVQYSAELCQGLEALRAEWRPVALIHRDMKSNNCLVTAGRGRPRLRIIDWELAGPGDPCWDTGSVIADYLGMWLFSIPLMGQESPDRLLKLANHPLERMQPALRAFWGAYCRELDLSGAESDERLIRSVRYAAARLVLTGFEEMQMEISMNGTMVALLQLGQNLLRRPEEAVLHLLGLPLSERSAP